MKWLSLRALVVLVGVLVLASMVLSSWSLRVVFAERDARIADNTQRSLENERRGRRACQRIAAVIDYLETLAPTVSLRERLDRIDREFPDVTPCNREGGGP